MLVSVFAGKQEIGEKNMNEYFHKILDSAGSGHERQVSILHFSSEFQLIHSAYL